MPTYTIITPTFLFIYFFNALVHVSHILHCIHLIEDLITT